MLLRNGVKNIVGHLRAPNTFSHFVSSSRATMKRTTVFIFAIVLLGAASLATARRVPLQGKVDSLPYVLPLHLACRRPQQQLHVRATQITAIYSNAPHALKPPVPYLLACR